MPVREDERATDDFARISDGLDALEEKRPQRRRVDKVAIIAPIVVVVAFIAIWQAVWASAIKPEYVIPSPSTVGSELWRMITDGSAWDATWTSLRRGVFGFVIALVIGTLLGLVVSQVSFLRKGFRPILAALQSMPSVAWVPFAVLLLGLNPSALYMVILLGAVPSIANGLIGGLDQTPPILRRAGTVLGAHGLSLVRHVLVPAALPTYLTGLKQGWAFSWRSLMAAELIVNSPKLGIGLGQVMENGRAISDMPTVIAAMILILIVGIVVELGVFAPIERKVLRDRGLAPTGI
ncbi:MAG TPA: ABC transporter permease [Flexivirga sp.]|uniref:ABC transporter permease n=1 Tax=Flexivirga sp. TaxID=1962927 RepID=UPI002C850917|nr:ABC transporter permease [Flexivirga sp.]HWC23097.1 ABC transporter permease [Flexivirga sp.]